MATSTQNPLPKRLKEARVRAGLSQKQLGIKAGIDEFSASPRMNQYEKGTHTPDFRTLDNIASVLELPTAYFYAGEENLAKLIFLYSNLENKKKKKLLDELAGAHKP
ncbi:MAG: helix-turn-helix transcriptional regulator [Porticoccaceae bacterium]